MASMRDIKRRIKSVKSTQQITKAMHLVASSKLTRARARLEQTKPFAAETRRVIGNIVKGSAVITHPYLEKRPVNNTAVIVLTGDRGLCGGYNANVCKAAYAYISDNTSVVTVGSKGRDYLKTRKGNVIRSMVGVSEKPAYEDALEIGRIVLDLYSKGEVDEVYLAYTEFISTLSSEPKVIKLLPVDTSDFESDISEGVNPLTIYEPSEEAVLDYVVPKYINTVLFGAMVESAVCELGARMTAMDSATENASEMIDDLNLLYNRVRQGAITQEITEIVSGSGIYD